MSVGNRVPLSENGDCETHFISEAPRASTAPLSEALEAMQEGMDHLGFFTIQSVYQNVPGRSPIFTEDGKTLCEPAIGYSHRMSANRCNECPWQHGNASMYEFGLSVIVPLTELQGVINTIKNIMDEYPAEFPLTGIFFRFLPSSDGLLAINSVQASVAIEWVLIPRTDRFNKAMLGLATSQAITQALITKHHGRPHWGKNGVIYTQKPILLKRYPHLPTFVNYMKEFDPYGIFLNDFGRRLQFGDRKNAMDSYAKHCALVDNCICKNDKDCGDGSPGSYLCKSIQSFPVCKGNAAEYDAFKARIVRKFVTKLKQR